MPELNKFLDLEGLKVFWDQINEKKQNRTIWYNGKEMLLEDCLNEIKAEIENVQKEIGNIEELDQINEHIEKIQSTLQEIDNQLNNLEENYVPESRMIGGLSLANDITSEQLQQLIITYPVLTGTTNPGGKTIGHKNQLYINENTGLFYICYAISNPNTSPYYFWRQIRINTDHIVSSVSSSSTDTQAPSAKLFYNTTQNLQSQFNNLEDTLDHEIGIFGYNDTIWYTNTTTDPLKYRPYSILNGTYEKLFSYCTISAQVEKVENWIDLYISLPVAPIEQVSETVQDFSGVQYTVQTKTRDNLAVAHIRRTDGQAMTRNTSDTDPNSYISFTLRYKYK